jgi:hypothetical protein
MTNASNCIANCPPSCERIRYAITNSASAYASLEWNKIACYGTHNFGASNFQYQYYTEQLNWSFFTFIAGLGGTVTILLGIDVVLCTEFCLSTGKWFFAFIALCWSKKNNRWSKNDRPIELKEIHIGKSRRIIHVQPKMYPIS